MQMGDAVTNKNAEECSCSRRIQAGIGEFVSVS
jgi:hypothetical protein